MDDVVDDDFGDVVVVGRVDVVVLEVTKLFWSHRLASLPFSVQRICAKRESSTVNYKDRPDTLPQDCLGHAGCPLGQKSLYQQRMRPHHG